MRIAWLAIILSFNAGLWAADTNPAAPVLTQETVSAAVATPAALSTPVPFKLRVTLKDGQVMDGRLKKYDGVTLDVVNAKGTSFSIFWREVKKVEALEPSVDAALMQQYLQPDQVEVTSRIAPKVPSQAVAAAFWPGILLHGAGYRAAGDNDTFLNLAGGELFSVVLLGFGLAEALGPDVKDESKSTSQAIAAAGGVIFAATWLWDIVGSASAARNFNTKNGLALSPMGDGVKVALAIQY